MKKIVSIIGLMLGIVAFAHGQGAATGVVNKGATGTTSATVIIPPGEGEANITDLVTQLDSGLTTGFVAIRTGLRSYTCSSAQTASSSVVWFANGTDVAAEDYILVEDVSTGTYYLRRCLSAATTSITCNSALTPATTTSDRVWVLDTAVVRPCYTSTSMAGASAVNLWVPGNVPTALTIDGNTTACKISVSGVFSSYK